MNNPIKRANNRRSFLTRSATALSGLALSSLLPGCSTFDEYFFDDSSQFSQEVAIIGGGLSGLYFSRILRQKQIDFKLFEANSRFGGRILSHAGQDYGASLLNKTDKLANQVIDELKLNRIWLDKNKFYLAEGMQVLVEQIKERSLGLLPYRNYRLRWQLIEVSPLNNGYELTFNRPGGQKKIKCKQLVLSLPPSQWGQIKGLLELPEMSTGKDALNTLKTENSIKVILPATAVSSNVKSILAAQSENFKFRQIVKKNTQSSHLEIDILHDSNTLFSMDHVYKELKATLSINYSFQKLTSEQFFNWQQVSNIQGAYFNFNKQPVIDSNSSLRLIGDNTIEGALQSALSVSQFFI